MVAPILLMQIGTNCALYRIVVMIDITSNFRNLLSSL